MSRQSVPRGAYGPVAQVRTSKGNPSGSELPLIFEITATAAEISESVGYAGAPGAPEWPVPGTVEAAEFGPRVEPGDEREPEPCLCGCDGTCGGRPTVEVARGVEPGGAPPGEWERWTDFHVQLAPAGEFVVDLDAFEDDGSLKPALRRYAEFERAGAAAEGGDA